MKIQIVNNQRFHINTGQDINHLFSYKTTERVFNRKKKEFVERTKINKIYQKVDKKTYSFSLGYIFYALNVLQDKLTKEDIIKVITYMRSDLMDFDPMHLHEWQKEDLMTLLKLKRGIFNVFTGAGKGEIIGVLVRHLIKNNKKVLIVVPVNSTREELIDRLKKFGINVTPWIDNKAMVNIINPAALHRSSEWEKLKSGGFKFFKSVGATISDEAEMCVHESYKSVERQLINCDYFYAFTATANKSSIDPIYRDKDLLKILNSQIHSMVRTYGFSAVYKLPENKEVNMKTVNTTFKGFRTRYKLYHEIVSDLLSSVEFINAIKFILSKSNSLYIPINNLDVINRLLRKNLTHKPIIVIQGSGIHEYHSGKYVRSIKLEKLKRMLLANEVHLILGTSSSFRALDLVGLKDVLITFGKATSIVIQAGGRGARGDEINFWYIQSEKKIKIFSDTVTRNQKLLSNYYRKCKINYDEEFL